ncbi:hypothetical protein E4T43_03656 [Aureobasidium subglaciale]|nr:hypothetical protein E4T43_03656 [Aureobasidium subglaciale]
MAEPGGCFAKTPIDIIPSKPRLLRQNVRVQKYLSPIQHNTPWHDWSVLSEPRHRIYVLHRSSPTPFFSRSTSVAFAIAAIPVSLFCPLRMYRRWKVITPFIAVSMLGARGCMFRNTRPKPFTCEMTC